MIGSTSAVALILFGVAFLVHRDEDEPAAPAAEVLVDPLAGTVQGVKLGDNEDAVVARLGNAPPWNGDQPVEPLDEDWDEIGPPSAMTITGTYDVLRYPHTSVELEDDRVIAIITAEKGATTSTGIGVGDDLRSVRAAYPALRCWDAPHAGGHGTYPVCSGQLDSSRWLWFGQDPIRSITLASRRLG